MTERQRLALLRAVIARELEEAQLEQAAGGADPVGAGAGAARTAFKEARVKVADRLGVYKNAAPEHKRAALDGLGEAISESTRALESWENVL